MASLDGRGAFLAVAFVGTGGGNMLLVHLGFGAGEVAIPSRVRTGCWLSMTVIVAMANWKETPGSHDSQEAAKSCKINAVSR